MPGVIDDVVNEPSSPQTRNIIDSVVSEGQDVSSETPLSDRALAETSSIPPTAESKAEFPSLAGKANGEPVKPASASKSDSGMEAALKYGEAQGLQIPEMKEGWQKNVTEALSETVAENVPQSAGDVIKFLTQGDRESLPAEIKRLYGGVNDFIKGKPLDEISRDFPEAQARVEAEKTPALSKERFKVGFQTLVKAAMASAGVKAGLPESAAALKPTPESADVAAPSETLRSETAKAGGDINANQGEKASNQGQRGQGQEETVATRAEQRLRHAKEMVRLLEEQSKWEKHPATGGDISAEDRQVGADLLSGWKDEVQKLEQGTGVETPPAPETIEPPVVNEDNGGVKPPPPGSVFAPDTPPGSDPDLSSALRTGNAFKTWWQEYWPRDLSVSKVAPDSPVISEHQRFIESDVNFMQDYTKQSWWKITRKYPNEEIIDLEDKMIKLYHRHLENGVPQPEAYDASVQSLPKDIQDVIAYRDSRKPVETESATVLNVEPPVYRGEPYIARLTNEEGKAVVELHPQSGGLGKQIRSTIGSFDRSREHPTMKEGIAKGTQYEPVKKAIFLRELTSARLEATANLLRNLKGKVLFDTPKEALAASPTRKIAVVRGLGGKDYYARTQEEATFLEQNFGAKKGSPYARMQQLISTYVRNPSLINPLPHITKNMAFKYALARVGNAKFKFDVAEFKNATKPELLERFNKVMPMTTTGERMPQIMAREAGSWAEKVIAGGLKINKPSSLFIFAKADPAMRYSLWKSYIRKGMGDQEAANHVWLDLIRYDANSGGMNFWKSIPLNFFVPWRTGSYVTLAKQFRAHPIRALLFVGAVEYLREIRYRKSGRWTHLPTDYLDAPLAEAVNETAKHGGLRGAKAAGSVAATTLIFGPGGSQAPNTIKDALETVQGDPQGRARVMNMFWGLSQIYNLPKEWMAYQKDKNPQHLVNLLTSVAVAEHAAIKYEPRRLMQFLPEWMPGLEKSKLVLQAEELRARIDAKQEKARATYQSRHGVSAAFESSDEERQLSELERGAGLRRSVGGGVRARGIVGGGL